MRILYFTDIRFPMERANGIQTMQTCHALAARGHRVLLRVRADVAVPPRDPFAFYELAPTAGLEIRPVRVTGPSPLRRAHFMSVALSRAVGAGRHDVLVTRDLGVASALLAIPRRLRAPVVYESHAFSPVFAETASELLTDTKAPGALKQKRLLARERRVWRRADGYVTTTGMLETELRDRFGPRPHVATIPNGVRLGRQADGPSPARAPEPVVAYAGHLYPWKGADVLVRALAVLPGVRGLVIGGHPAEPDVARIRTLASTLEIEGRMTFAGLVGPARVSALLRDADVLVMPTTETRWARYTSPLKLFEYMAAGKPIVASGLPAIREILTDGENACLVAPGDAHALAAGIRRVLDDPALAARIARRAFEDAAAYSWDRRAERLEALLSDVVKRP